MGDVTFQQTIKILAGKTPVQGSPITDKDFFIDPPITQVFADMNENDGSRFAIPDGTVDQTLPMGTVAVGKILVMTPESDLTIKLVNSNGTSQAIVFRGGYTSVLHTTFTGLLVSNSSGLVVKGKFFTAGD